ncbi:MAG: hypothetical protein IPI65_22595 [Bacteroidetes bacterium]|nr:hypothetical protein [Bacteroidota bacterium]
MKLKHYLTEIHNTQTINPDLLPQLNLNDPTLIILYFGTTFKAKGVMLNNKNVSPMYYTPRSEAPGCWTASM